MWVTVTAPTVVNAANQSYSQSGQRQRQRQPQHYQIRQHDTVVDTTIEQVKNQKPESIFAAVKRRFTINDAPKHLRSTDDSPIRVHFLRRTTETLNSPFKWEISEEDKLVL